MSKLIRHGELILKKIEFNEDVKWEKKQDFVASHSETGHHHVIAGSTLVFETEGKNTIVKVTADTTVEHRKNHDRHETLDVPEGTYECIKKVEYDPIMKHVREVQD